MQSHGLSCEILPTILQNIYFYCSYSSKKFLEGHERAFRGLEAVIVLLEAVRVLVEAIRVLV